MSKPFQDYYEDTVSHCYGCGRHNKHGLQIKSYWEEGVGVCRFTPAEYHTAVPGFVYGGLIASLIDCHCIGTAAAAIYRAQERPLGSEPVIRCVTASLHVDYLKPTPIGTELEIRATVLEVKGRKVRLSAELLANGIVCATGEVVGVQIPDHMLSL